MTMSAMTTMRTACQSVVPAAIEIAQFFSGNEIVG